MNLFYLTTNINLQKAVLLLAIVALIIATLVYMYKMRNKLSSISQTWPPVVAPCPDYWDVSGNYCVNSTGQNKGNSDYIATYTALQPSDDLYSVGVPSYIENTYVIPTSNLKTNRKIWAKNNGFVWDGLTSDGPQ